MKRRIEKKKVQSDQIIQQRNKQTKEGVESKGWKAERNKEEITIKGKRKIQEESKAQQGDQINKETNKRVRSKGREAVRNKKEEESPRGVRGAEGDQKAKTASVQYIRDNKADDILMGPYSVII